MERGPVPCIAWGSWGEPRAAVLDQLVQQVAAVPRDGNRHLLA